MRHEENAKVEYDEYRLNSSPMMFAPGMLRAYLAGMPLNETATALAAKLYFIAHTWPGLPCEVAIGLACDELDWEQVGEDVVVKVRRGAAA
jgi:hypothetical protein